MRHKVLVQLSPVEVDVEAESGEQALLYARRIVRQIPIMGNVPAYGGRFDTTYEIVQATVQREGGADADATSNEDTGETRAGRPAVSGL